MVAAIDDIRVRDVVSEVEDLYSEQYDLLLGIAVRTFRVPREDAATLVHDVFVSLISRLDEIRDRKAWLVGAICNASRSYLRRRRADEGHPIAVEPAHDGTDACDDLVAVRQALERIDDRSREILRLRYVQGYTVPELAGHLRTTSRYTEKLLRKALLRAWEAFGGTDERAPRRPERRDAPRV